MTLYAIDPGTEQSAWVEIRPGGDVIGQICQNAGLVEYLRSDMAYRGAHLVIERIESFGMAVGKSVFSTVFWSGRFVEAWDAGGGLWSSIGRRDVKLTLCGSARAKDANIRQALIDRYGGPAAIKKGGPLYGIKSHLWAALAVGVAYQEIERTNGKTDDKNRGILAG